MKTRRLGLLLGGISVLSFAQAEALKLPTNELSFKTRDGRDFEKAIIIRVVGPRVEVARPGSLEMLNIADLPPELGKHFAAALAAATAPKVGEIISFRTTNGRGFKDVWLRRIEPNGITVETAEGLVRVDFTSVPEEFRLRFNYNAQQAAQFEAQRAAAEQARALRAAAEAKAAAVTAAAAPEQPAPPAVSSGQLGEKGERNLGTPRLGGSGAAR